MGLRALSRQASAHAVALAASSFGVRIGGTRPLKTRSATLVALLLTSATILAACRGDVPTAPPPQPEPTVVLPTMALPTLARPTVALPTLRLPTHPPADEPLAAATAPARGGVDIAWKHVIQPEVDVVARVNGVPIGTVAYLEELRGELRSITQANELDWNDE